MLTGRVLQLCVEQLQQIGGTARQVSDRTPEFIGEKRSGKEYKGKQDIDISLVAIGLIKPSGAGVFEERWEEWVSSSCLELDGCIG